MLVFADTLCFKTPMHRIRKSRPPMRTVRFPVQFTDLLLIPAYTDAFAPAMDVDAKKPSRAAFSKKRITKKRSKSSITFPKYSDRLAAKKKREAANKVKKA